MSAPLLVTVPMHLVSTSNRREHGAKRGGRNRRQKESLSWHLFAARPAPPPVPAVVTLVRWSPRRLETDNLATALKSIRDEVARYLRLPPGPGGLPDDSDPRVRWRPFGAFGRPAVTICIEPWPDGPVDDGLDRLEVCAERRPGALAAAFPNCTYLIARKP